MTIEFGEVNRYDQSGQFPAVDLIFTGPKKSLVDRVSGKSLQFTRNTIGTYVDENGLIKTAAAGEPRYTYDPMSGESLGLLVEESRTNVTWPSDFSSNWNYTIVGDGIKQTSYGLAPDGTISSFLVQPNSSTRSLRNFTSPGIAAGTYTVSFFYKGDKPRSIGGPGVNESVPDGYDYGNGWKRAIKTLTFTGGGYLDIFVDANTSVELWGIQVELGSFPTSYIPTTSSTVTRDPDIVTLTNDNLYNNSQFDIINDPFGMSAGSNTLTLLPSNSANSAIKRATIFSSNITQTKINTFAKKTDEFWRWRVLGSSFGLPNFLTDGQVTVDWGDGTVETLTTSDHTFTNGGGYHDIGFRLDSGTYFRPTIGGNAAVGDKIYSVGPAPESMKVNATQLFWNCDNLKSVDATFDIVNSANSAFYLCDNLKNIPKVNTTGITDFTNFARECASITSFPLLDISSATLFRSSWANCSGLTSFPANFFDSWAATPDIDCFVGTWTNCTSLTSTSVENILTSISVSAASGTPPASGTDITISYNASSGTPDITVPAVDLIAKGWVPTLNGSAKNNAYSSDFATLDLDFATNLSLTDNISGNNLVTFSRDSIGTYVDSNGVIQTATANTPRFDHDPETGESLGLLVEESRTNFVLYSEDVSQWSTSLSAVSPNETTAPDGTLTADLVADTETSGNHFAAASLGTLGDNVNCILSVYLKANTTNFARLRFANKAGTGCRAWFDLSNGTTTSVDTGCTASITSAGNGWYRCILTGNSNTGAITPALQVFVQNVTGNQTTYDGDGSSVYVWGAQLEAGSFPTSYIPNNGTPGGIIRAADVASISGTDLTSWFNQSEGTFRVRGQNDVPVSAGNAGGMRFMSLSTGPLVYQDTTYNFSSNSANYGAVFGIRAENGSNNNFYGNIGWTNTFPTQNYVGSYNSTSSTIGYNNVSRTESFNFTLQSDLSHMWIGRMHNFGPNRNHIGRISYWPKKLTDKSIQFLSQ